LSERGAIKRSGERYVIDYAAMPGAISDLAKQLLQIEATGDRAEAEKWFSTYDTMPGQLKAALKATADIPVDVEPVFSWDEGRK
jgi:hypothetical protein